MNHAIVGRSERLRRVLKVLKSGNWYSTLEIQKRGKCCAVNSIISELRCNGAEIQCIRSGDIWRYRMTQGVQ